MPRRVIYVIWLCLCVVALSPLIIPSAFAVAGTVEPSAWSRLVSWIMAQQRAFHEELVTALKALADSGGIATAWGLILGSFLYGIFHAAGPGHGKVILTTYLLTHPHRIRRGVGIAGAAALCQGFVAIILVYGLIYLAGWIPRETSSAVAWSERLSYLLVAGIGALLILRTIRQLFNRYMAQKHAVDHSSHDHHHDDGCGHAHMPSGDQIEQINSLRSAIGVILAIGLRPCTGAVLVLVLAKAMGLPLAGIGAVIAMSFGTGMAVALLAFLAVAARQKAAAATADSVLWQVLGNGVALAGGGLLLAIGVSLLSASFYSRHPLGL